MPKDSMETSRSNNYQMEKCIQLHITSQTVVGLFHWNTPNQQQFCLGVCQIRLYFNGKDSAINSKNQKAQLIIGHTSQPPKEGDKKVEDDRKPKILSCWSNLKSRWRRIKYLIYGKAKDAQVGRSSKQRDVTYYQVPPFDFAKERLYKRFLTVRSQGSHNTTRVLCIHIHPLYVAMLIILFL